MERDENKKKFNMEEFRKEHPFKVPEDYFDNLPGRIQKRLEKSNQKTWYRPLLLKPSLQVGISFVLLIGVSLAIFFGRSDDNAGITHSNALAQLSNAEIVEYLIDHDTEFEITNLSDDNLQIKIEPRPGNIETEEELILENLDYSDIEEFINQ